MRLKSRRKTAIIFIKKGGKTVLLIYAPPIWVLYILYAFKEWFIHGIY